MGRRPTTGGVAPAGDRITVRFTWQGQDLRPTLDLKPTAANLRHAQRLRQTIQDAIKAGTFRLADYFPDYRFADRHQATDSASTRSFGQWAELWGQLAARDLEHSTIKIYRTHLAAYWTSAWGSLAPRKISHEMVLTRLSALAADKFDDQTGLTTKGLSRKTQNNILIPLRAVFDLICKSLAMPNPTDGIKCLKVQGGAPDPFTPQEIELILADLRRPRGKMSQEQALALTDYYAFAAYAGLRPSEQIALRWVDVDFRQRTARVSRSSVLKQTKERTKTHTARTVELNDLAWSVVERQRARTQMRPEGLVFLNPFTDRPWNTGEEQRREWQASLRRVGVRHRPPKELRDTSVTMALAAGADPYWVARQHGHSVQTMMKDYAGWIPKADRGRNLAAVNAALGGGVEPDSAIGPR
jgi:integrase